MTQVFEWIEEPVAMGLEPCAYRTGSAEIIPPYIRGVFFYDIENCKTD